MNPTRRQFLKQQLLTGSAIIAAGGLTTLSLPASATAEDVAKALADFVGDSETQTGKLSLKTPEIAENGNTVPISFNVESDMTDQRFSL